MEAGNHIAAIVVPGLRKHTHFSISNFRRRRKRQRLLAHYVGNTQVRLIEFGRPYDWDMLGKQLSGAKADVLICYAFPNRIPQSLLDAFPRGGLNLHPALLPYYRGPHPFHRLVADGQQAVHGGVTLHRMTAGFDEGDILAQVPFCAGDWHSLGSLTNAAATSMRMLASEAVPAYCRGALTGLPQPAGDFGWARLEPRHLMISQALTREHADRMWQVLGLHPGIYVDVAGQNVRLAFQIRRLGPPTGKAAAKRWGTVALDLADGRVLYFTYSRLLKRLVNFRRLFARTPIPRPRPAIQLFGKVEG
ncbi:formyltransferase family protein [Mesorhizobium sp. INR15]|uniref:formyltransferase family protein n=1 Tax=Mesorhizobium sp. INR15 TaxID=2654248 RepID=UPI0018966C04|nr:formyltransferase family protein [Mesorhizobium sp. INR15]QPC92088.1 hypothetical protein GA829_16725 [Mesorhizobium sp. INR15]